MNDRQVKRRMIDRAQRARLHAFVETGEIILCAGCGAPSDGRTIGCKTCTRRHSDRRRYTPKPRR